MMNDQNKMREWATPVTIGAFALIALTGVMLFFKVQYGLVKPVHEWLSWLLVIGAVFHLIVNWQATVRYFSRPVGRVILIVFLVLIGLTLLPIGSGHKRHGRPEGPSSVITEALSQSTLAAAAQVVRQKPEEARQRLEAKGMQIERIEQTLGEIAAKNQQTTAAVLEVLFEGSRRETPARAEKP